MYQPITAKTNEKGHLEIGGCDVTDLAAEFGTPLYILDEITLRGKCREYKTAFKNRYENSLIIYANKALCTTAVVRIIEDEGLGMDVVSGGELFTVRKANCSVKNVYFHGNNKSRKELREAVEVGVGRIVVDCLDELQTLDEVSAEFNRKVDILFRVNPGIDAHTHEFVQTGKTDSKFGIAKDQVLQAVKLASKAKYLNFIGLHSHIGSQIFAVEPFTAEITALCDLGGAILKETGIRIEEINMGGGLGIDYTGKDHIPPVEAFAEAIVKTLKERSKENDLGEPKLVVEPGRSIVGNAGVTLYTVGVVKDIPGIRKYVSVDGGMADNPRPITYGAVYQADAANKMKAPKNERVTIAGRFCESGDKLITDITLPALKTGDLLAVYATGAYNYSMSSNYNRVPRPAMLLVNNGTPTVIIKRETYDDLVGNDVVV